MKTTWLVNKKRKKAYEVQIQESIYFILEISKEKRSHVSSHHSMMLFGVCILSSAAAKMQRPFIFLLHTRIIQTLLDKNLYSSL